MYKIISTKFHILGYLRGHQTKLIELKLKRKLIVDAGAKAVSRPWKPVLLDLLLDLLDHLDLLLDLLQPSLCLAWIAGVGGTSNADRGVTQPLIGNTAIF